MDGIIRIILTLFLVASVMHASVARSADDIVSLSDEMGNSWSLSDWLRINVTEGWNADQLEAFDIATTTPGWMHMPPTPVACLTTTGAFSLTKSLNRLKGSKPLKSH